MEVRLGYKQTELGLIPDSWKVERIVDCCEYADYRGKTPPKTASGTFLVTAKNVRKGFIDYQESQEYIPTELYDVIMRRGRPRIGDVLITTEAPLGNVAQVDREDIALAQRVIKYRPKSETLSASYLKQYFLSEQFQRILDDHSSGSTAKGIKGSILHQLPVVMPPPTEQRAIAMALSDVDALLNGLDRLIAKKRDLKQAAMQQLLTGQTRLPGFSGEWEVKRLGDVLTICHGKSQRDVEVADGPYPILATGGQIGTARRALYNKPSVLIGRKGTINQPQYMEAPFWTVDTLFYSAISGDNSAKFLYYRFCLTDWMQFNEASGVPSLNARTIESIKIDCPESSEQTAIAAVLSDMDTELSALEARRNKTRALKQAMMQELLTGKTRLVPLSSNAVTSASP